MGPHGLVSFHAHRYKGLENDDFQDTLYNGNVLFPKIFIIFWMQLIISHALSAPYCGGALHFCERAEIAAVLDHQCLFELCCGISRKQHLQIPARLTSIFLIVM